MPNKSLQQRLEEARANSPINNLTNHQQALKITHEINRGQTRTLSEEGKKKIAEANIKRSNDPAWQEANRKGQANKDFEAYSKKMQEWWSSEASTTHREKHVSRTQKMGKKNAKPIMTPDGEFPSLTKASEFYGITKGSMKTRMSYYPENYYYIDNGT
ncbi:hypothetical protein N9991_00170 [bacterium]|jgi:hypothetical protein|nr:hypothetical protein [bacterium]